MTKKVLIMCTSAAKLGSGDAQIETGCWVEEVAAPYYIFQEAGYEVTIASIAGGEVPMDEASLNPPFLTKTAEKFLLDDAAVSKVEGSLKLADVKCADFDAIFLPGGHGTVADFPSNEELAKQLTEAWVAGKVVAAVCHGPLGLVGMKGADGAPAVKGKKVTGFSNAEEHAVAKEDLCPFLLEDKLKELGGEYVSKANWAEHAIRDGKLVTGQNPGSSELVGKLVVEALSS